MGMNPSYLASAMLLGAIAMTSCFSQIWKRMANADRLLDLLSNSTDEEIRIERVSDQLGQIATAHLRVFRNRVYVSGLVQRKSSADPPPWSHIDILVLDTNGRVLEASTMNFLPSVIPHGQHGSFAQSAYAVRLAAHPPINSTVKVVFHSVPKSMRAYGRGQKSRSFLPP